MLHDHWLTDVDEINPLGIEIWYGTTTLDGMEAIWSVPKKYPTSIPSPTHYSLTFIQSLMGGSLHVSVL